MKIGDYTFDTPLILAPMAGVTDQPFRNLCHQLGADLCISEMVTAEKHLWNSRKTQRRLDHTGEKGIRCVQIAGTEPKKLAAAARYNAERGAQIIDINMGCPAKKVCNVQAGSALLKDEKRVANILSTVVDAVTTPVTLKIRTGWDANNKNAIAIARVAEQNGVQALTIHGRTRADAFRGEAEYDTIANVKASVSIPVIANGDITSPEKASAVLKLTAADGLMIGRAAQGNPWIFRQIQQYLHHGELLLPPDTDEICQTLLTHIGNLHDFYGEESGVRIARKHIGWYINNTSDAKTFKQQINRIDDADSQLRMINDYFITLNKALAA